MTRIATTRVATSTRTPLKGHPLSGVWALKACNTLAQVQDVTVSQALANSWVKGFSVRIDWQTLWNPGVGPGDPLGLIPAAAAMVAASGVPGQKLAVRFVAGTQCPTDVLNGCRTYVGDGTDPCITNGQICPAPFNSDGSPNTLFEGFYSQEFNFLVPYAQGFGAVEIRAPWYGDQFAELNLGLELRNLSGYSYASILTAHKRIFDIAYNACIPRNLPVEHPMSGCGPLGTSPNPLSIDLATYMTTHPRTDLIYVQGNGASMQSYGYSLFGQAAQNGEDSLRAALQSPLQFGAQMINVGDQVNWPGIFAGNNQLGCRIFEIYTGTSFSGANAATLAAQAAAYNAYWGPRPFSTTRAVA